MMFRSLRFALCIVLLCATVGGGLGCAIVRSPEATYYVLRAPQQQASIAQPKGALTPVHLRRVMLPAYLERNALVTGQANSVRVTVPQYHAWAEPLDYGIRRVLFEAISPALTSPVQLVLDENQNPEYWLSVEVLAFEGALNGTARLQARYRVEHSNLGVLHTEEINLQEPAGASYDSLVQAQSSLVCQLGARISSTLNTLRYK
ncbi:MAG: PqiC family protein [Desulfovibrionaceae bacterium]|nr:PqiC family protein [Desulfovibrionaceae bacterium]